MALFKSRKARDEQPAPAAPAQSVEAMRRHALHRLIGAAVLVLAGVVGFPLVFDNQPRPIPVDLPIEIADKGKVKPLVTPAAAPAAKAQAALETPAPAATPAAKPAPVVVAAAAPAVAPEPSPAPAKATPAPETPTAQSKDASKAQALLEGKDGAAKAAAGEGRFVVQVGAFSDAERLREVRRKIEGTGLKTYTQVVETKDGSRTRVRVGPFPDKEEATKVAEKIRKLDLPASILSL